MCYFLNQRLYLCAKLIPEIGEYNDKKRSYSFVKVVSAFYPSLYILLILIYSH